MLESSDQYVQSPRGRSFDIPRCVPAFRPRRHPRTLIAAAPGCQERRPDVLRETSEQSCSATGGSAS